MYGAGRYTWVNTLLLDLAEANPDLDAIVRLDGASMFTGSVRVLVWLWVCVCAWVGR